VTSTNLALPSFHSRFMAPEERRGQGPQYNLYGASAGRGYTESGVHQGGISASGPAYDPAALLEMGKCHSDAGNAPLLPPEGLRKTPRAMLKRPRSAFATRGQGGGVQFAEDTGGQGAQSCVAFTSTTAHRMSVEPARQLRGCT